MRLLIAEDDPTMCRLLVALATSWGYDPVTCADGLEALATLRGASPPDLVVLDWMLPGLDGPEVCRRFRRDTDTDGGHTYILLLTARAGEADVVKGLDAGADDYLTKPFVASELSARLRVGARMVALQRSLATSIADLTQALANVRRLKGLLPICAYCKSIRDDSDYWHRVEHYLSEHSEAEFTHGICPDCFARAEAEAEAVSARKPEGRRD